MTERLHAFFSRCRSLFTRRRDDNDTRDELEDYVSRLTEQHIDRGRTPAEAARLARVELGGMAQIAEELREDRSFPFVEMVAQDLRYAARSLRRNPGFAISAVLMLAVGIAASTGLFAVVDALMLQPFPYAGAERIARVQLLTSSSQPRQARLTADEFSTLRHASTMDDAYVVDGFTMTITGTEFPESVSYQYFSGNALLLLGAQPVLGRVFTETDAPIGKAPQAVVVLTHQFWQRHFAGEPNAIGQVLRLNGEPFTVIGVLPTAFSEAGIDIVLPLPWTLGAPTWAPLVRVRAGVPLATAEAELQQLYARFAAERPNAWPQDFRVQLRRLVDDERSSTYVPIVTLLFAAAGLLLLIGCANVAILLLARGQQRMREIAVRHALGAGRGRLVSLLFSETLLLTVLAAVLAVLFAHQLLPLLLAQAPGVILQRANRIAVGTTAIAFATSLSATVVFLSGLWPAVAVTRPRNDALRKASSRGSTAGVGSSFLVAAQVAVAVVLLSGTTAAVRALVDLYRASTGFDPNGVTLAQIQLPENRYRTWSQRVTLYDRLRREVASVASVESASISLVPTVTPPQINGPTRIDVDGLRDEPEVMDGAIASDYFSTLRIPLVRGRMWSASDDARGEGVAVINETMARQLWPNDNPIGKRVRDRAFVEGRVVWRLYPPGRDGWFEVVGVVRDTPNRGLLGPVAPAMYYPYTAALGDIATLIVRTKGNQASAERDLRTAISRADANLPIMRFFPPDIFMGRPQGEFVSGVLLTFSAIALLLASFGLFSVVSYAIVHRTREFAIRLALGASRGTVLRAALQSTTVAVGLGLAFGVVLSVALHSVSARWSIRHIDDPSVLAAAIGVLLTATLAATLLPARRATSIEPAIALRTE